MNTYSDNMSTFLNSDDLPKNVSKDLAVAVVELLGGERDFIATLKDTRSSLSHHRIELLKNRELMIEFYTKNKEAVLFFAEHYARDTRFESVVHMATNHCKSRQNIELDMVAKALFNPAPSDNSSSDWTWVNASAVVSYTLISLLICEVTNSYHQFINNGAVLQVTRDFLLGLCDVDVELTEPFAKTLIKQLGGEEILKQKTKQIKRFGSHKELQGFSSGDDTVGFYRDNKKQVLESLALIAKSNNFNSVIELLQFNLSDNGYLATDIAKALYDDRDRTAEQHIIRITTIVKAVDICLQKLAELYSEYFKGKIA